MNVFYINLDSVMAKKVLLNFDKNLYRKLNVKYGFHFESNDSIEWGLVYRIPNLPISFIERNEVMISYNCLSLFHDLNNRFLSRFYNKIDWVVLSRYRKLSERFIEKHSDKVRWNLISSYQILSERFIRKHKDEVCWRCISCYQHLSEKFIDEFKDIVSWEDISKYQPMSEGFIRKHIDKISFDYISSCQKLSEDFISEYADKLNWYYIILYQDLSEEFIKSHIDYIDSINIINLVKYKKFSEKMFDMISSEDRSFIWENLARYQKLSNSFALKNMKYLEEYKSYMDDNWNYKHVIEKKDIIINTGKYECHDDYFIAYKAIRDDRYSIFNFIYKYEKGGIYESWCDCSDDEDSFGLSVGTSNFANKYGSSYNRYKVVRCKVRYEDVGRVVHDGDKIRCFKIEVLD